MKRIALLGATGSIGRQAIEVIDAHPELELVAATSGSQPIEGLAPLTQTGGDPTALLERAEPDVVLNAVVGFAGLIPTMWALENGVTLALANKESLVAAGELALAARARGGGELIPVDSEHSALFQCALLGEPESLVLTASGGPFRGRTARGARRRHPRGGARAPDLDDGPEDHDRLGHACQQGPRGDRGALPLRRPLRAHRGRDPSALDRARARPLPRRRRDRASREPRHARPDLLRAHLPRAGRDAGPAARARTLEFHEPDTDTFRMLPLAREAGERGGTYPCAYNAANEVAVAGVPRGPDRLPRHRQPPSRTPSAHVDGAPARDLAELVEADRARKRAGASVG